MLQPNTDPHEYEPRPSDVEAAAGASLVFANGDDLDAWIDQIVSDSGSDAKIVDLGAGVPVRLPGETSGAEASTYDPHWWHDPRNAEAAVREIERDLAAADPAARAGFERRADAYLARLRAARRRHRPLLRRGPAGASASWSPTTTPSATSPSRYGIDVVGAVIPSQTTQAQPSAKDLARADRADRSAKG